MTNDEIKSWKLTHPSARIMKRSVDETTIDDLRECCGCVNVVRPGEAGALSDGWYCRECIRCGRYNSDNSPDDVQRALLEAGGSQS